MEDIAPESAQFNQAVYQQQRIHERMLSIDRLNVNPLYYDSSMGKYNYEMIFTELCNLSVIISEKMTPTEKLELEKIRIELGDLILRPVRFVVTGALNRKVQVFNGKAWNEIQLYIYKFRIRIIELMGIHGYGNPSKDDPRRSVLRS